MIYMPINQPSEHWFLAEVRLKEWLIHIIDSLYIVRRKQVRIERVRPLVKILLHVLDDVHFFNVWLELNKR